MIAGDLAVDVRSAGLRVLPLLQQQEAAPSDSTKPSRSVSNGRLAVAGSARLVESTLIRANAATVSGLTGESTPPASAATTCPSRIRRIASPMAMPPLAQAAT